MSIIASATMSPIRAVEKATWRIGACMPVRRRTVGLCFVGFEGVNCDFRPGEGQDHWSG
jgi:hypothetical protein